MISVWWHSLRCYWRELFLALIMATPVVAAFMLGMVFLWQSGWMLFWWIGLVVLTVLPLVIIPAFWKPRPHGLTVAHADAAAPPAEHQARAGVQTLIDQASAEDVENNARMQQLLLRTVNAVASAYCPNAETDTLAGVSRAALRFTLPEILLMSEDLTHRLRAKLMRDFPVLRHIEVGWMFDAYSTGSDTIKPLYEAYRVARWVNPVSALLNEAQGMIVSKAIDVLGAAAKAQVAAIVIREVGEVAIALYSGRYRRAADECHIATPVANEATLDSPLTIVIAGRINSGKSSLLNALLGDSQVPVGLTQSSEQMVAYRLEQPQCGALVLIDSPGIENKPNQAWLKQISDCDLMLWVVAANRADRAADQRALNAVRELTRNDPRLRSIPLVLVATHADRLNPPLEWSPPYDVATGERPKERTMRQALHSAAERLAIPLEQAVLVALPTADDARELWNLETLWQRIHDTLPLARQKQLERGLRADGWFKMVVDGVRTVPGTVREVGAWIRR